MKKVTAIILTKNEEKNIKRLIKSLNFCDEVLIIDDESIDNTVKIAEECNVKALIQKSNLDFATQRNSAIKKARNDWVLFVDADEEITDELKDEIVNLNSDGDVAAYYLKRRDFFWGRELKYGETAKIRREGIIRLVKKNTGNWEGHVHEEFKPSGNTVTLKNYLNHYPHQTLKEFLEDINFYSSIRAKELLKNKVKPSVISIIFYPLGKFLLTYVVYLGFLDGAAGFAYSFLMSFHSFLVRSKLYQYVNIDNHKKISFD